MQQIINSMKNKKAYFLQCLRICNFRMVRPDGFEPPTPCSEDRCSDPLSYGRVFGCGQKQLHFATIVLQ